MGGIGFLLFAISTGTLSTDATVRTGCDSDASEVASLRAGAQVEVRSALSGGDGRCYKVTATVEGKQVTGYVPARQVQGTESFDVARRAANRVGESPAPAPDPAPAPPAAPAARAAAPDAPDPKPVVRVFKPSPYAAKMKALIDSNQPGEALSLAEEQLAKTPGDPMLLALAGLACYRLDNVDRARDYWRESQDLSPDPAVAAMIELAQRERSADRGSERKVGARVMVRYERDAVPAHLAQAMLAALDEEYSRISAQLGCRAAEKVTAILQSRQAYMESTAAAEWSGALYDGRIHVPVAPSAKVDARTRQTLAHELVHACLSEMGQWPAWLQEGLAQKYSGESTPRDVGEQIQAMIKAGKIPKLNRMGRTFAGMSSQHAQVAYAIALVAAERLTQLTANTGIQNVLRNPAEFGKMVSEVEDSLGL